MSDNQETLSVTQDDRWDILDSSFSNGADAVQYLKTLAQSMGFKLSSRDSINSDRIRLYCHRGIRGKGKKHTTKTDCQFKINLQKADGVYHCTKACLEHNHDLLQPKQYELSDETKNIINEMKLVGIPLDRILDFVHHHTGVLLTKYEIGSIENPYLLDSLGTNTEDLINYVYHEGGRCEVYEIEKGSSKVRAAVMTIMPNEKENLEKYGDVIFLDSTEIRNSLGWTTIPIILINEFREIVSGGVIFAAWEKEDMFLWVFSQLNLLIGEKWTTLFTDEDSAEMTAFNVFKNNVRPNISHRLCIWHKRRNFERNLKKIAHTKKALASAMQLFHIISTSPNEIHVHDAISKLSALFPEFIPYIETEITQLLPLFTEAFREDAFTLDYSTTSPSESANHMIKSFLPVKINNLQQIREGISKCFLIKQQGRIERFNKRYKIGHFLTEKHGIILSPANFSRIDEGKVESKKWAIIPDNPNDDTYIACKNETRWSLDPHQCQCNEMTRTGMPCPHIVALYDKYAQNYPVKMISPRWIVNLDEITIPDLPELSLLDNDFRIHQAHDQGSDSPIEEENEEEIHESSKMTIKADSILQSDKYHSLLYLGKEIAKHGCHTVDILQIKHDLEEILDKVMICHGDNLNQVCEIQEAGARRRGRPRKHGFSKSTMPKLDKKGDKCPLCKKSHELSRCPNYKIFKKVQSHYQGKLGRRKCKYCGFSKHNKATCPVMREAQQILKEKENQ